MTDTATPPAEETPGGRPPRPVAAYEGWKEIADALTVSEDTAFRYSQRPFLPLVVFYDHANRVWCPKSHVDDFMNLHHLPAWAYVRLKDYGMLPHQLDADGARRQERVRHIKRTKSIRRGKSKDEEPVRAISGKR